MIMSLVGKLWQLPRIYDWMRIAPQILWSKRMLYINVSNVIKAFLSIISDLIINFCIPFNLMRKECTWHALILVFFFFFLKGLKVTTVWIIHMSYKPNPMNSYHSFPFLLAKLYMWSKILHLNSLKFLIYE